MKYDYSDIIDPLLDWFYSNARSLVWRDNPIPYFVWISEVMLQQTRVEAVKSYFDRFIGELPDVYALASVEDDKLYKLWEGLGYYNRAKNLKKAAEIIVNDYNGQIPADYDALLTLPGIGSYTSGAISSIAFQIPQPAVDGNVLRVTKRVAGSYDDITKASVKKELEDNLRSIMPPECPGDFNQSLMELGALICIPNGRPLCDTCPIAHLCNANNLGIQMELPVKPAKKKRTKEEKTILLIEHNNEYAIRKRDSKGLLAGLWELPHIEGKLTIEELEIYLIKKGLENFRIESLGDAKHIFSHIEWHMVGYFVHICEPQVNGEPESKVIIDELQFNRELKEKLIFNDSQSELKVSEAYSNYDSEKDDSYKDVNLTINDSSKDLDYSENYTWATKEIIDLKYSLPTAFKAYYNFIQ